MNPWDEPLATRIAAAQTHILQKMLAAKGPQLGRGTELVENAGADPAEDR